MRVKIIAVGSKMPAWVETGYSDYAKRLPRDFKIELVELPLGLRDKKASRGKAACRGQGGQNTAGIQKAIAREGVQILAAIPAADRVIALDVKGNSWSTEQLAQHLARWRMEGDNYSLLIGGPDGLAPECLERSEAKWSLSALTLPHPLVRIVVIEQLYRAWTLLQNHPYHK